MRKRCVPYLHGSQTIVGNTLNSMISGQSLHMKLGEGEASYGRNSKVQNAQQNRMKPFIENAVTSLMESADDVPSSVVIADLGCSFGPNALGLVSTAVSAISQHCSLRKQAEPEICVLLNDLPSNDFNSVAKSLVALQQSSPSSAALLTGIVPGSFYNRLFTSNSLNLVLSSNSLHWLSQPPEILKSNGIPMYDNDEGLRRTRRPLVVQAYAQQFRKDFTVFLGLRAKELVPGGRMVVSLLGSCASRCIEPWDTITVPLNDMASRGFIRREMVDSFYVPMHAPSNNELSKIIDDEGSFKISKLQVHELMHGMDKGSITSKKTAIAVTAIFEPIIVQHFTPSEELMHEFVTTLERHLIPGSPVHADTLDNRVFLCVSLTRV